MALQIYDLLAKGYFPKELPPPFTTISYAQALANPGVTIPAGAFTSPPLWSMSCTHNLARTGAHRRLLSIPNPKHYFLLANHIVANWSSLKACADNSLYSLSKPVDDRPDRAILPEYDLSERTTHRAKLRASARFILIADISHFFPSIYTHSLTWAIMGKAVAKAAHSAGTLRRRWEDLVDVYSRSINNNQTVGIPIGPDTSRLLAEVLLSHIDVKLAKKFNWLTGIRYIDDYELGTTTRSQAEEVFSYIQQLLSQFELSLNVTKSRITELPDQFDPYWTSRVRVFIFRDAGVTGQRNDLTAYFDMVFDFYKRFPDEGLLKYAVARLRSLEIYRNNWSFFENILSQCVLIEPACIPQVCDQIIYYRTKRYRINKKLWAECLNRIVYERVPLGHSSEAAWAMWLMKILNIKLLAKSAKAVGACEDSVTALMGLGLAAVGLTNPNHLSGLHHFSSPAGLFGEQWLLCYQGNMMAWLGPSSGRANLRSDPAFLHLESKNVSFFDIGIPPPAPVRLASPTVHAGGGGAGY